MRGGDIQADEYGHEQQREDIERVDNGGGGGSWFRKMGEQLHCLGCKD